MSSSLFRTGMMDEDDELRQLLGLLPSSTSPPTPVGGGLQGLDAYLQSRVGSSTYSAPYERNWLDRLVAPLEAPQQTLFALTTGRGLWESISHGARYFNPWSNTERIDPEEVRETLFGEMADGWKKSTANLAISLLFDPLLVAPMAKIAGASSRVVRVADKLTNPAALMVDGAKLAATEVLGPAATRALRFVGGEAAVEKVSQLGTNVIQAVADRFYGVDPNLKLIFQEFDLWTANMRGEGVRILKNLQQISPDARILFSEAMETQDIWLKRHTDTPLTPKQTKAIETFEARVLDSGADPALFWQTYDRARKLDTSIGQRLLDLGAISETSFKELQGTHLRRMYQAFENPTVYAERIEALNIPLTVSSAWGLRKDLTALSDDILNKLGPIGVQAGLFDNVATNVARYFDATGRFHAKNFTEDLLTKLRSKDSSLYSLDEMNAYIKNDMLGGIDLPPEFIATIDNYLASSSHIKDYKSHFVTMLRQAGNTPTFTFRTYSEALGKVADRKFIPEEIREILGEIIDPMPRIASEVLEAGGVAAARQLFTRISGAVRVSADDFAALTRGKELGFDNPQVRESLTNLAERYKMSVDELAEELPRLIEEGPGSLVHKRGSAWASPEKTDNLTYQIPNDASYGDMAGMWVDGPTYAMLRASDARDTIRSIEGRAISKLGDLYRDGVGIFKMFKTVMDPVSQIRNFVGAGILADMAGAGWGTLKNLPKIISELSGWLKTGDLGHYMKLADEAGVNIWKQDFTSVELRSLANNILEKSADISGDALKNLNTRPLSAMMEAMNKMSTRIPGVQAAATRLGQPGGGIVDAASSMFQAGDQFWKLGVFIDRYDNLANAWIKQGKRLTTEVQHNFAKQAASLAQQALFNYADVPWLVDFARKWGVVPFATFPFKAVPFVAKTLYDSPWRVLKYDRVGDAWNSYWAGSPEEAAEEIDGLPRHLRDRMVVKLPWNDASGRAQYMDFSYFLPWETIRDLKESTEWDGGFREGIASPPIFTLFDAVRNNKDSLNRPIVQTGKGRTALQNFEAIANFFSEFMLPSWVPGGSRANSIGRTMMAVSSQHAEPVEWKQWFQLALRSPLGASMELLGHDSVKRENIFGAQGQLPQTHAQVAREGPQNWAAMFGATMIGGASASVPGQGAREQVAQVKTNRSQLASQIAAIRGDDSLSIQEKNKRIARLYERYQRTLQ